jgi:beta-glucosidase-like glycosyl hydrolase/CubicO group peptidase (beta-lactamase class C family)
MTATPLSPKYWILLWTLLISNCILGQSPKLRDNSQTPPFLSEKHEIWADSILEFMSLKKQMAQLLMPPIYSHSDTSDWAQAEQWASEFGIGGVICMQGTPSNQVKRLQRLQDASEVPMLVSTDGEWGLGMRLDSTRSWPRALTLGATQDTNLIRSFGQEVGKMLRSVGVHVNFAPVVDVNSNANNPVIGSRSFGENPEWVARLGSAYALGMQDLGVLATAKHFPGHGDSDSDSHLTLPSILHDTVRLNATEIAPFRALTKAGVGAMMAAHLYIPALDSTQGQPSTLSPQIIDTLLRQDIGFKGLVFTDAMTMKGFTSYAKTSTPHADALLAGNDILLFPDHPAAVIEELEIAVAEGRMDSIFIATKCRRVLQAKSWCRVYEKPPGYKFSGSAEENHRAILASSITAIKNNQNALPFSSDVQSLASLFVGWNESLDVTSEFNEVVKKVMGEPMVTRSIAQSSVQFVSEGLPAFQALIRPKPDWIAIHVGGTSHSVGKNYGVNDELINQLEYCAAEATKSDIPLVVVIYGSPYLLERLETVAALSTAFIVAYQDDERTVHQVAEALTGAGPARGVLPVSSGLFKAGTGNPWMGGQRLGFSPLHSDFEPNLDRVIFEAIENGAMPGCRLVVSHLGQIIHDGAYGTTNGQDSVTHETVYDLASITKIAATSLAFMQLEEQGIFDRTQSLGFYLPELQELPLGNLLIEDILAHRSGLKAWIPFYIHALEDSTAFASTQTPLHTEKISNHCFMRPAWKDSIWQRIVKEPLDAVGTHRYSDLGFYALARIFKKLTQTSLDEWVQNNIYERMGWASMGYLPISRHAMRQIAPTELDTLFRKTIVQGQVHDPGAAMLGGVSGHAGLFSNAYDLTRLMHCLIRGGDYGRNQLLKSETIEQWTRRFDPDPKYRKGLGFDRPESEQGEGPTCDHASWSSFGHSGFTGTLAWADPDHDLIFVFLSNRTYPDAENRTLIEKNIRTELQRIVYESFGIPERF